MPMKKAEIKTEATSQRRYHAEGGKNMGGA
jgi:hypothetical protein